MKRIGVLGCLLASLACDPAPLDDAFPLVEGLAACTDDVAGGADGCVTHRAITGASMGGGAAARVAFTHPELFDAVGVMGTPLSDLSALWAMLRDNQLGGFCDLATLEAGLAADPAFLSTAASFCGAHDIALDEYPADYAQVSTANPATPDGRCPAFRSDFLHWYRGPEEGRGSPFERSYLVDVFYDLLGGFGNPLTPDGSFAFPGAAADAAAAVDPAVHCAAAGGAGVVVPGVISREHNPDGAYPAITFCDGSGGELTGDWSGDVAHDRPIAFGVAVDINGNGVRDLGEPLVKNDRERFDDVDGDGQRDDDEPFDDDGLDGVLGTADYGEGNGAFDESPALARWRARSPATLYTAMPDAQVRRLSVWMDAGVRDFLNSAQISNSLYATMKARADGGGADFYQGFAALPGAIPGASYEMAQLDVGGLAHVSYLQYGDADRCPASDPRFGDGNHVGPDVIDRITSLLAVAAGRMPEDDRKSAIGGDLGDLGGETGTIGDFAFLDSYESEVLGRTHEFGVLVPPDYFVDVERRYPVIYFLHGQGNSAQELVGLGFVMWGGMKESAIPEKRAAGFADMQRSILIFPDGQCLDDDCFTGTFYADFEGLPRDDRRFETALYELMRAVEERYRTLPPAARR